MPRNSKFIYTGIIVSDIERSIEFYISQLGMKLLFKTDIAETGGKVAWLKTPGSKQILELNWYPEGYKYGGKSGLDHLAFEVKDVEKFYANTPQELRTPLKPFVEGRWTLAYVKDPDGNWIELGHREKKKAAKKSS